MVKYREVAAVIGGVVVLTACFTNDRSGVAFSDDWRHHLQREREKVRRDREALDLEPHLRGATDRIEFDKEGDPRLNLYRSGGFHTDFDFNDGAPSVGIRYELNWGGKKRLPPVLKAAPPVSESESE